MGEMEELNKKMNDIQKTKRIKKQRRKQYEAVKDDDGIPDDIIIDSEIIQRRSNTNNNDADDEYDDDDDMSDDEVVIEVDYFDTDSVISEENIKNKLDVNGKAIDDKERLYLLTRGDAMYTNVIKKKWNKFIAVYNKNINNLETMDAKSTDDGDESKENDALISQQKIKRKYSIGSFPLLHQFANLRLRMERIIKNEINTFDNLDRFVHIMINRIFNKCNDLSIDGLIEFAFKRLEAKAKKPNVKQFGSLTYDFQKELYDERCSQWLYYWHSTMRRIMEFATKKERVYEENGCKLIQQLIDRYIAAVHSIRNRSKYDDRIINALNTLKLSVYKRGSNLTNCSLVKYTIQCLRRRRVNDDIVISKEKAMEILRYYLDVPSKINNGELQDSEYDEWRNEVYKIYGTMLNEMVKFRHLLIKIRTNKKRWKKMNKRDQNILTEDLVLSNEYIAIIYDYWSKHLEQHMHAKWDDADKQMQALYIMMKRNYKNIGKLAQIYEKEQKVKEEAEMQQQRENEELEYQKQQTLKNNDEQ